jgi:hypothetical protein
MKRKPDANEIWENIRILEQRKTRLMLQTQADLKALDAKIAELRRQYASPETPMTK